MEEFLFLFRGGNGKTLQQSPEKWQAHLRKWMTWMSGLQEKEQLISAQPLDGRGKQISGINKVITDGPFMEGIESVSGYLICKAGSYDEAIAIAKDCPILDFDDGNVEVREIQEIEM